MMHTRYLRFVHPSLPVLSLASLTGPPSDCSSEPPAVTGIFSAIYALAAPFTGFDDELSVSKGYFQVPTDDLWAIAHRSFQRASRSSHLSLLQLCLLLVHMPPHNFAAAEPPSAWSLSCSAVAIAESLGLNLEPSSWQLPRPEIMLRRRLWWLTYMHHVWQAVVFGRPSHIHEANWDVSPLTCQDFDSTDNNLDSDIRDLLTESIPLCLAQLTLSTIAADVLQEF